MSLELTWEHYIVIMIVLDAIIATLIPPYMTWRRAQTKVNDIADQFGIPIAKKAFAAIKPDIEKSVEGILLKFSNTIESKVNTNITNVINNDVKHMIQDANEDFKRTIQAEMDQLVADIPARNDFETLVSTLRGVISATGVKGKAAKAQERQAALAYIQAKAPDKVKSLNSIMMAKKLGAVGQSEVDTYLQMLCAQIQQKEANYQPTEEVQVLQGTTPEKVASGEMQATPQSGDLAGVENAQAKELVENIIGDDAIKVIENLNNPIITEGEKNGKAKKKK